MAETATVCVAETATVCVAETATVCVAETATVCVAETRTVCVSETAANRSDGERKQNNAKDTRKHRKGNPPVKHISKNADAD